MATSGVVRGWQGIGLVILALGGTYFIHVLQENFTAGGLYRQAQQLQKDGNCYEAVPLLDRALRKDESLVEAYFLRGLCEYRRDHYDQALADFNEAIRRRPTLTAAFYDRALVYLAKNNDEAALADFEEAIKLDPSEPDAHYERANILRRLARFDEAIAEYAAAGRYKEGDLRPALLRAETLRDKGDLDAAITVYDAIIAVTPDEPGPYMPRAATRRDKGEIDVALNEVEAFIKRWPDLASGYLERGTIALFYRGEPAAAADDLANALNKGISYRGSMVLLDYGAEHFGVKRSDYRHRLAPFTPFVPDALYWALRLHIAHVRAGQNDDAEFAANVHKIAVALNPPIVFKESLSYWPNAIVRLYLGKGTVDDVRAEAKKPTASSVLRRRTCDADFYIAEYFLAKDKREAAGPLLEAAAKNCPPSAPERGFAAAELKRLVARAEPVH